MHGEEQIPPETDTDEQPQTPETDEIYEDEDDDDKPIMLPKIKQFLAWFWRKRKLSIPVFATAVLAIIFIVPVSRYIVLGLAIKRDLPIVIKDNVTGLPVSDVQLSFRGQTATTDGDGHALFHKVPVGYGDIVIKKPYYDETQQRIALGLSGPEGAYLVTIKANGRQVPVQVVNKITGERLVNVNIVAGNATAITDQNGEATLVLPPNDNQAEVTINHEGYNQLKRKVTISLKVVEENTLELVSEGRVYFLSRRSGQINIMKANLDGSDQKVVIRATGQEDANDTVLLATRDWRYLALKTRRSGETGRLYLVDTKTEMLIEIDGADDTTINPIGWSGNHFVYSVDRSGIAHYKANKTALKSFDATNQNTTVIDQNLSEGNDQYSADYQQFSNVIIVGGRIVYGKHWVINSYNNQVKNKKAALYEVEPGQSEPRSLREFGLKQDEYGYYNNHLSLKQTSPDSAQIHYYNGSDSYYTYSSGSLADAKIKARDFQKSYPLFLDSPGGLNTFWYEERDGKNTLFVGDQNGKDGQVIAASSPYKPYGWFTDRYVLISNEDSELYIMPSNGTGGIGEVVKITNYHSPTRYYGHGGGYGGL